jgi:hypothetical protein
MGGQISATAAKSEWQKTVQISRVKRIPMMIMEMIYQSICLLNHKELNTHGYRHNEVSKEG